jgi:chromosomal replication initiator protein
VLLVRRDPARKSAVHARLSRAAEELPFDAADRHIGGSAHPRDEGILAESSYALNPRYRFDNFVVGPSNQLAHAASIAVSSCPGKRYNPLFIYSRVGLGKTHLVNAVGHRVLEERPNARVLYLSAERFTNEFIWALQNKRIDEFRARYRAGCDVLVIDDIQFLAGREQTQAEFFHTFNALYHADKQIVVTSDVYPEQIPEMQERLISRFQWGLVADIQAPELDTRIAILKKKAEQEQIQLDDDVALFIAQLVQNNVRELEGTLLRLAVLADAQGRPLDLEFAKHALGSQTPKHRELRQVSVEDIQRATCEYFQISMKELMSDRRHRNVSLPRMIAMYICREMLELSYPMIGARFGNKDHTTVMNAYRKIRALSETDERVRRAIEVIEQKVGLVG